YRRHLEQAAQIKLAIAEQAVISCRNKINDLKRLRKIFSNELAHEEKKGINAQTYQMYKLYIEKIDCGVASEQQRLKEAITRRDRKREDLKTASIKKKSLEHLKGIEQSRYTEESNRLEQKIADELSVLRRKLMVS
ncbi:MAG: flagellar export protein FliJ, partial [Deltaproteobacteria bacterium]|nr:flagellar export protein FliJ [Deltaproteobacteria bacterium]